jgi:hypothetical protein
VNHLKTHLDLIATHRFKKNCDLLICYRKNKNSKINLPNLMGNKIVFFPGLENDSTKSWPKRKENDV